MAFGAHLQSPARQVAATTSDLVFGNNVTAGNLLLAFVNVDNIAATITVTDSQSNTYALLDRSNATNPQLVEVWYAIAGSTGACTQTAVRSVAGSAIWHSASEFEGPFSASDLEGASVNNGATGTDTTTGDITPVRSGSLLIAYISADASLSQTTDWTEIENSAELNTLSMVNAYKLQTALVVEAFSATQSVGQTWGAVGGSFNPNTIDFAADSGSYAITGTSVTLARSTRAGYIYRVDIGTEFDSETITSYVTLPWTQAPNPQSHDKTVQWLDLTAYLKGTATVNVDARFANEPHEFSSATFTTYGTIGATPDGDKGFVYLGVTSRWMQVRLRATSLAFEIQPPIVIGFNQTGRRI